MPGQSPFVRSPCRFWWNRTRLSENRRPQSRDRARVPLSMLPAGKSVRRRAECVVCMLGIYRMIMILYCGKDQSNIEVHLCTVRNALSSKMCVGKWPPSSPLKNWNSQKNQNQNNVQWMLWWICRNLAHQRQHKQSAIVPIRTRDWSVHRCLYNLMCSKLPLKTWCYFTTQQQQPLLSLVWFVGVKQEEEEEWKKEGKKEGKRKFSPCSLLEKLEEFFNYLIKCKFIW